MNQFLSSMMVLGKWAIYFALAVLLQMTIMPQIGIGGVYPDAVLILLFILAIEHGRLAGIWAGFFAGLLADVYSPGALGALALANTVVGAFVGLFSRQKINAGPIVQLLILIAASIMHDLIHEVATVKTFDTINLSLIFQFYLPRALYTALISSFLLFASHYLTPHHRR